MLIGALLNSSEEDRRKGLELLENYDGNYDDDTDTDTDNETGYGEPPNSDEESVCDGVFVPDSESARDGPHAAHADPGSGPRGQSERIQQMNDKENCDMDHLLQQATEFR